MDEAFLVWLASTAPVPRGRQTPRGGSGLGGHHRRLLGELRAALRGPWPRRDRRARRPSSRMRCWGTRLRRTELTHPHRLRSPSRRSHRGSDGSLACPGVVLPRVGSVVYDAPRAWGRSFEALLQQGSPISGLVVLVVHHEREELARSAAVAHEQGGDALVGVHRDRRGVRPSPCVACPGVEVPAGVGIRR